MTKRHIEAWSAFMTLYHSKNGYRVGDITVEIVGGEVELTNNIDEPEGVTTSELAEVLDCSKETARRRLHTFRDRGLAVNANPEGYRSVWKPSIGEPDRAMKKLQD